MFDISFGELLVCAIIALLVLGPERLPNAARTVGRWVGRARHTVNHFTDQIDREIRAEDLKRRIEDEMKKVGVDDINRQVSEALHAPLPLIGPDHRPDPGNNRIAPPVTAPDIVPAPLHNATPGTDPELTATQTTLAAGDKAP